MKKILIVLFSFMSTISFAQELFPEECDWIPDKGLRIYHIRWDGEECPKIWEKYRGAFCIYGIDNGWKIRRRGRCITPEYVIMKEFDIDKTPTAFGALQYAYNYFVTHPDSRKWESKYLVVLTCVIECK